MELIEGVEALLKRQSGGLRASVVTIGNFDGIHRGHEKLIESVQRHGQRQKAPTVVVSFHPHPAKVLAPEKNIFRLFSLEDQVEQLARRGIDYLIRQPFTKELAQTPALDFLQDLILRPLHPKAIAVGYDFRFGRDRSGDFELIRNLGQKENFSAEQVSAYQHNGEIVSTSRIREMLVGANLSLASELLGRNYYVSGTVEKGEGRGEKLGIPTANLAAPEGLPLPRGVYITQTWVGHERFNSVTNIGLNPTFEDPLRKLRVETFIFDLNKNLYDEKIKVEFFKFLRVERKFKDAQELIEQVNIDIGMAKKYWHGSS